MRAALALALLASACGGGGSKAIDAPAGGSADAADVADAPMIDAAAIDAPPGAIDARIDAMPAVDARPSTVKVVDCAGKTPVLTVTTNAMLPYHYVLTGANPIAVDDVVEFKLPAIHNAVSGAPPSSPDGAFTVGFGADVCLQFTAPGPFPFYCSVHLFTATITVQ